MCKECGCSDNSVTKGETTKNGKPTKSPYGEYEGVGGTKFSK